MEDSSKNLPALMPKSSVPAPVLSNDLNTALQMYLKEVSQYPLLKPEQENELAMRLRDTGDLDAAKGLVTANLRLVVKIALEYKTAFQNVLDLIQEGNVGLMKAVSKYDPDRGVRLAVYATWWIRSYILKYILDNFRLVKIGTTSAQKKLFYNLIREKQRLESQGIDFEPKLIATSLGVKEKEVIEMDKRLSSGGAEVSLDTPFGKEGRKASPIDYLEDESAAVDEILESEELRAILTDHLKEFQKDLNERDQVILKDRLLAELPKTLQEIADSYGISRERARQLEARIISRLKKSMKEIVS